MKRNIQHIVVHCTATQPSATVEAIKNYWYQQLGWKRPGYHYIILRDGSIVKLYPETQRTNGVKGFNETSIHLSYIGGIDLNGKPLDNRTEAQKDAMFDLIIQLSNKYPQADIHGHRDFPNVQKACPSFDVKDWLKHYEPRILQAA